MNGGMLGKIKDPSGPNNGSQSSGSGRTDGVRALKLANYSAESHDSIYACKRKLRNISRRILSVLLHDQSACEREQ